MFAARRHSPSITLACVILASSSLSGLADPIESPRPLHPAERYGAQLAVDYLDRGASALWDALATGSPLRSLGRETALAEIEARAGSPNGARWELRTAPRTFPPTRVIFAIEHSSGLDQALVLNLIEGRDGFRLQSLRSLAEPLKRLDADAIADESGGVAEAHRRAVMAGAAALLAAALLGAAVTLRRRTALAAALVALGGAWGIAATVAFPRGNGSGPAATPSSTRPIRLGALVEARARLERGEATVPLPGDEAASQVVRTWGAQLAQQRGDTALAEKLLSEAPRADEAPWADVVRARLGFLQKRERDSIEAYQRVIDEGVFHDGLLAEAESAFSILGYQAAREWALEKLAAFGSRSPETYYLLARELQASRQIGDPAEAFGVGWRLRPLDRIALFRAGQVFDLVRRREVFSQLGIGSPTEPTGDPGPLGSTPLRLPERAEPHLCATHLRIRFANGGELVVPFGAALAPPGFPLDDAAEERRQEIDQALADLPVVTARLGSVGAMSQPQLRRQLERTCFALAHRHRWRDLATLTAGFSGADEKVPAYVVLLRAESLRRTNRVEMSRGLLADFEKNPILMRHADPVVQLELGELLRAFGDLPGAIRATERAARIRNSGVIQDRLRRLRTLLRLEGTFATVISGKFDLRYPRDRSASGALEVGRILGAEWSRMAGRFPSLGGRAIVVDLLPYETFAETFGPDILGLYDGRIYLPVVGVTRFSPSVVATLTHELAHAMIADATDDRAPSWLHEGLAQRLEMKPIRENRLADLEADGTLLALSSIEEVLKTFVDPELVKAAYQEAEWLVLYLERRFGTAAIMRLLEAYRAGLPTEEAIPAAVAISAPELDRRFRAWALKEAPRALEEKVGVRYDFE